MDNTRSNKFDIFKCVFLLVLLHSRWPAPKSHWGRRERSEEGRERSPLWAAQADSQTPWLSIRLFDLTRIITWSAIGKPSSSSLSQSICNSNKAMFFHAVPFSHSVKLTNWHGKGKEEKRTYLLLDNVSLLLLPCLGAFIYRLGNSHTAACGQFLLFLVKNNYYIINICVLCLSWWGWMFPRQRVWEVPYWIPCNCCPYVSIQWGGRITYVVRDFPGSGVLTKFSFC